MGNTTYIKTTDEDTANKLIESGYELVIQNGNSYTFLNCSKLNFDSIDTNKIATTNILCM